MCAVAEGAVDWVDDELASAAAGDAAFFSDDTVVWEAPGDGFDDVVVDGGVDGSEAAAVSFAGCGDGTGVLAHLAGGVACQVGHEDEFVVECCCAHHGVRLWTVAVVAQCSRQPLPRCCADHRPPSQVEVSRVLSGSPRQLLCQVVSSGHCCMHGRREDCGSTV